MMLKSLSDRFWAHVDKSSVIVLPHVADPCWVWIGRTARGYGSFYVGGPDRIQIRAHRFSYELSYGEFDSRLYVCHRCDVKNCVRPEHLFLGTQDDNMRDAAIKGRLPSGDKHAWNLRPETRARGERHGKHKLTEGDVREIRVLSRGGMSQRKIAKIYGISFPSVQDIIHGVTWKHV
jgi:DNA-binding transcriptional regulator YiaG